MVGILIQLGISWVIIWYFERENLSVLGFKPSSRRLLDFVLFFFVSGLFSASGFLLKMFIAKQSWQVNPELDWLTVLNGVWFGIKSTLYEELIFRGVLFYILIKRLGGVKAVLLSGIGFGIYHWFSHELFWNLPAMAIEFSITGLMGLVLAFGFTKSRSLYIPIAIHLGWGIVQMVVFSNGIIGNHIFIEVMPRPIITISYSSYFFMELFPLIGVLGVCYWLIRNRKQE